ncbi:hypothetical protein EON63_03505 [archaeon]|nr:MAG: hypothetical protein EON63_03505 [archaeon]
MKRLNTPKHWMLSKMDGIWVSPDSSLNISAINTDSNVSSYGGLCAGASSFPGTSQAS